MEKFTPFEMMILTAAKQIKNGDALFIGFHWPMVAPASPGDSTLRTFIACMKSGWRGLLPVMPNTGADLILSPHLAFAGETMTPSAGSWRPDIFPYP